MYSKDTYGERSVRVGPSAGRRRPLALGIAAALLATGTPTAFAQDDEEMTELQDFIVVETDRALKDTLLPTEREISGLFGDTTNVLEVPRQVTLLSPKMLKEFAIDDLSDLSKVGAGTQTVNFYGIPGTPIIRGAQGGTYLNGMLRAYQRNEMPLSFGSLEAIEIVKGPAQADFSTTLIGGYVNLVPKSPYFDEQGAEVGVQFNNWGQKRITADAGAPFVLPGGMPAAFRASFTGQDGPTYWDDVENDYISTYGSLKFKPNDNITVYVGGEYFDFQSNENAGWNRPTQNLIDNNRYVIGEPAIATSPIWNGTLDRNVVEFPSATALNPAMFALGVPGAVARSQIPAADLANMLNLNNPADRAVVYDTTGIDATGNPLPADTVNTLNAAAATPQDTYLYTPAYFANGGQVLTQDIEGSDVLSDNRDFADSRDVVLFGDLVYSPDGSTRTYTFKFLFEDLVTEKRSSYGYAIDTEQTVYAGKAFVTDRETLWNTTSTVGVGLRYTDALILQDFFAEPFARRDITRPDISPNTVLLVGDQSPVGGLNLWSPTAVGGANVASELLQAAFFASFETQWTDRISSIASVRVEHADFDISLPTQAERAFSPANAAAFEAESGNTTYVNWMIGPKMEITDNVFLYGNFQRGTSLDPTQGGAIFGEQNFSENEMWEVGLKAGLLNQRLYASIAYYNWEQSQFNVRDAAAERLEAKGLEIETTWQATDALTIISSFTNLEVKRLDPLGFRSIPMSEQDWALYGGELTSNFSTAAFAGSFAGSNFGRPASNPDLVYPGFPEKTFKIFGIYDWGNGLSTNASVNWQEEYFLDFDRTKVLPSAVLVSLGATYEIGRWQLNVGVENLTDEEYFLGADPIFAANTLVTKAPERTFVAGVKFSY